jgi:hypothetical protein
VQQHDVAQRRGKLEHEAGEQTPELELMDQRVGAGGRLGEPGDLMLASDPAARAALAHQRQVDDHARQPRLQRPSIERRALGGDQHRVMHQVIGGGLVVDQARGQPAQPTGVADELLEHSRYMIHPHARECRGRANRWNKESDDRERRDRVVWFSTEGS